MKQLKVLSGVVLILFLCLSSLSLEQKAKEDTADTADGLLLKGIEYLNNNDKDSAYDCFLKAAKIDRSKSVLIKIIVDIKHGEFAKALYLLKYRSVYCFLQKERRVIQILTAATHFLWAEELEGKANYENAIKNYEEAYSIDKILRPRWSAIELNNIGTVYFALGQMRKALEYYEMTLPIYHEVGDRSGEAAILSNIGKVYYSLGQNQKALEFYEKALLIYQEVGDQSGEASTLNKIEFIHIDQEKIAKEYFENVSSVDREVGDRSGEAATLNNIGMKYYSLGQNQKALGYYEKALSSFRKVGDRSGEATTLNNIGMVYHTLGQNQNALEYYQQALSSFRKIGDRSGEATTLNNIGMVYDTLGQNQKALEYYNNVLPIFITERNSPGQAAILNKIGMVYDALGQKQKALEYYENALYILDGVRVQPAGFEITALNNIGMAYFDLSQRQKALECFDKVLPMICAKGDIYGEAITLNNIGKIYSDLNQNQKALEYYEKALAIARDVVDQIGEAIILNNIRKVYFDLGQNHNALAIFFGKQAANAQQFLRHKIEVQDIKTKLKYLKSEEDTYRTTVSKLISSGRLCEAQQVLGILKDEEYFAFALQNRPAYKPKYSHIDYTEFERKWIDLQNAILGKMSSINRPYHELFIKPNKTPEEQKKLEALKVDLIKTQREYNDFLYQMKKEFEKFENKENTDIETLDKQSVTLKRYLKSLGRDNDEKNAVLHFLVYKGQISIIITTPTSQTAKHSPTFDEKELNKVIHDYHSLNIVISHSTAALTLDELSRQKRDFENKLYTIIFQPVDQYLKQYGVVNLLISLDGVLRYIPLGSLWDGQHYLVQQYRFVLLTPSSLKHMDEKTIIENKILGMGASRGGNGFTRLPFVLREIRAIVNDREKGCSGIIPGNALIDNDFTRETMIGKLKTSSYPMVHIASHFQFNPGDEAKNQLLLGDGTTMSLSDIRKEKEGKLFDGVKLLVLSACQTGTGGNGEEIDGFGELAQQCGAGSVIASLWAVDDKSTKELMVKFYSLLKEGKVSSKIEALRQAQLELAGLEDLIGNSKAGISSATVKETDYSNPYYWAPFIMMGNGR